MAKAIGNDKAIEFQSELLKTKRMIDNLATIGVDSGIYSKRIKLIEEECRGEYSSTKLKGMSSGGVEFMQRAAAELTYTKAIGELLKIQSELKTYEVYFSSFNYVDTVDFSKEYTEQELDVIAKNVIKLLNDINASDTRYYASEKLVVEKLYSFAYQVIKLELRKTGKSKVLDWAKNDAIAANFIDHEIENDVASLDKDDLESPNLKSALANVKSMGLSFSYLDDGLILYLSIQNDDTLLNDIRKVLIELSETLEENTKKIKNNEMRKEGLVKESSKNKKEIRKDSTKLVLKTVASLSLIAGLIFGGIKFGNTTSKQVTYSTKNEVYSQSSVVQTPKIDDYQKALSLSVDDGATELTQTKIIEYGTWNRDEDEGYIRDVTTYDVSEIDYSNLSEYLNLDLEALGIEGATLEQTKDTLNPDDLYDEAILEVERIIQDLDNENIVYELRVLLIVLGEIIAVLIYVMIEMALICSSTNDACITDFLLNIPYYLSCIYDDKKELKKMLLKIKELLESSKKLVRENEEVRERFAELYQKYAIFLHDKKIDQKYQKLIREKGEVL